MKTGTFLTSTLGSYVINMTVFIQLKLPQINSRVSLRIFLRYNSEAVKSVNVQLHVLFCTFSSYLCSVVL